MNGDVPQLAATMLWRRLDLPGHDACALWAVEDGWRLTGTALFALEGAPCCLDYTVECDADWRTRAARVSGWMGEREVQLVIAAEPGLGWHLNGIAQPQVTGCAEVDLSFTPATNLIPLRRLSLEIGEEAAAPAAWLRFPELTLTRLQQRYRRLDEDHYDYHAPDAGYSGKLEVNPTGFITRYPGLWEEERG